MLRWRMYCYSSLDLEYKCALSDKSISFNDGTASVDRIDSKIGYVSNNIQIVHKDINIMKNAFDQDYFIDICKRIVACDNKFRGQNGQSM